MQRPCCNQVLQRKTARVCQTGDIGKRVPVHVSATAKPSERVPGREHSPSEFAYTAAGPAVNIVLQPVANDLAIAQVRKLLAIEEGWQQQSAVFLNLQQFLWPKKQELPQIGQSYTIHLCRKKAPMVPQVQQKSRAVAHIVAMAARTLLRGQ